MSATLEHANVTVTDPVKTAAWLCDVFDWHIRWQGEAIDSGHSIHVGNATSYLALYNPGKELGTPGSSYATRGGLNHVAVVVDDLDSTETRVRDAGFKPGEHHDYEPGERFYFRDHDGIEFEVVSYAS